MIERIEGGLLSYGNEFTLADNPLECGLGSFCQLDGEFNFIGKQTLQQIQSLGISRDMRGVLYGSDPAPTVSVPLPVLAVEGQVGQITSGIWSPRFKRNVGLSMIQREHWDAGTPVSVNLADGSLVDGVVSLLPFS